MLGGEAWEEAEIGGVLGDFSGVRVGFGVGEGGALVAADAVADDRVVLDEGLEGAVGEECGDGLVVELGAVGFDEAAPVGADQVVVGEDRIDRRELGLPGAVELLGEVVDLPAMGDLGAAALAIALCQIGLCVGRLAFPDEGAFALAEDRR